MNHKIIFVFIFLFSGKTLFSQVKFDSTQLFKYNWELINTNKDTFILFLQIRAMDDTLSHPLGGANHPPSFDTWAKFDKLSFGQKQVLCFFASIDIDNISPRNSENLQKLITARSKWPSKYYSIHWGKSEDGVDTNTCNIFACQALLYAGKRPLTNSNKFPGANAIYNATNNFVKLSSKSKTQIGDIVAWSFGHVEIVSRVDKKRVKIQSNPDKYEDRIYLCTRGGYRSPIGGLKCGTPSDPNSRRIDNDEGIKILRFK